MITLAIYFVIYLIVVLIPYFFLSDVSRALFGIEFPQPSMGLLFLSFFVFSHYYKAIKNFIQNFSSCYYFSFCWLYFNFNFSA